MKIGDMEVTTIKKRFRTSPLNDVTAKRAKNNISSENGYDVNLNDTITQRKWHSSVGMITRVLMKNFMCHGELDYRPTERLNFLHGANGSGKVSVTK